MKVLLYRYGSICEPDIIDGMKELGHDVLEITDEIYNKELSLSEIAKSVSTTLLSTPCDVVFTINFFPSISEVCRIMKIPYISWIVDSPVMELFSKPIQNDCNRIFLFDREQYREIEPLNPGHVFHFPLAVNITSKQNVINKASDDILNKYKCDVSFVGSLYSEKNPYDKLSGVNEYTAGYLDGILEAQLNIYGYYFIDELLPPQIIEDFKKHMPNYYQYPMDNFLTDKIIISQLYIGNKITALERQRLFDNISQIFSFDLYTGSDTTLLPKVNNRGFAKTLTEMPIIFNQSKVNLNPTSKAIRSGIPLRVFDIMACEGFLLSNYQNELSEFFVAGEDFDYYTNIDEAIEKTHYYLEHDSIRCEIANNAFKKVSELYNYPRRLEEMFKIALQ